MRVMVERRRLLIGSAMAGLAALFVAVAGGAGTSPAAVKSPPVVAFADNSTSNYLSISYPGVGNTTTDLGVAGQTTPAIAVAPDGSYEAAIQGSSNVHHLFIYTPSNVGHRDTGLGDGSREQSLDRGLVHR